MACLFLFAFANSIIRYPEKGYVVIVIHDEAVQNFLRDWRTEKSLLEAGAITQEDYFDWKIRTHVVNHCLGPAARATDS